MQLTLYTDYSLRVLMYLGMRQDNKVTISEMAGFYGISRNHLVKVVHDLASHGYIRTQRGKGGGMFLARAVCEINIGDVVRHAEPNFHMVECFNSQTTHCPIFAMCSLKGILNDALSEFLAVLDKYTLEDLLKRPGGMALPQFMETGAGRALIQDR